jgi:hypothetical protein
MRHFTNPLTFHDSAGPIKRFIGVEMEISDFDRDCEAELERVLMRWNGSIVDDGSINGTNRFELRTSPARGKAFEKQMREICRVLRKGHAKANASCGMHMHIDARDLGPNDLIKISYLWPVVEDKFFAKTLGSRKRANSGYCSKWAKSLPTYKTGQSLINMYDDLKMAMENAGPFKSLNYEALRRHGTIENRIHHGTINITKILNWAQMNNDFIAYALESNFDNLPARAKELPALFPDEPKTDAKKKDPIIR